MSTVHYNADHLLFNVIKQFQGKHKVAPPEGVQTEFYPVTGDEDHSDHLGIEIVTTSNEGYDFYELTTQSTYKVNGYKFPKVILSTDMISIKIIAEASKHALGLHSKQYDYITTNNPIFKEVKIPDKTIEQIINSLIQIYKAKNLQPGQNN